jgi:hypothetical protein
MSGALPDWLPELIDTDGKWNEILERLYAVFEIDFKTGGPRFDGLLVRWDQRRLEGDSREEGFWHLVTRDDKDVDGRLLDTPRAKRLRWCRATIDHSAQPDVLVFDYLEGNGKVRTYLWVHEHDYVVILEKVIRKGKCIAFFLVTAFLLDRPSRVRAMEKKYKNQIP